MTALTEYVDMMNLWSKHFTGEVIDVDNMTDENAQTIFNKLECDLSPENLHCDGEISRTQARAKERKLMAAGKLLLKMGFVPADKWSTFL